MYETVTALCRAVQSLSDQVKSLIDNSSQPSKPVTSEFSPNPEIMGALIREEIVEMKEREKRRDCLIIKELNAVGIKDARDKTVQVLSFITDQNVPISSISHVVSKSERRPDIHRIKITNYDLRNTILTNSKKLRNSEFSSVFINRDLTYKQRQYL